MADRTAALVAACVLLAACGGSGRSARQPPAAASRTVRVVFGVPPGTPTPAVDAAATALEARLAQLAQPPDDAVVTSFAVRREDSGIAVETPEVLEQDVLTALAAPTVLSWRPATTAVATPPCSAPATPSDPALPVTLPSPTRAGVTLCYALGPALEVSRPVRTASARKVLKGWVVDVSLADSANAKLTALARGASGGQVAMIADDRVVVAPTIPAAGLPVIRIAGELRRGEAKGLAAALAGGPLPVALTAPAGKGPERPIAAVDHWVAPIGVNICGTWLPNAPETTDGLHSHGDGFVHIHPFRESEAGRNATLGLFFRSGDWSASTVRLKLWDRHTHRNGDRCDGEPAKVRWSVNGAERTGDPSRYRPQDGDVIAIAFLADGADIGTPPSASTARPDL